MTLVHYVFYLADDQRESMVGYALAPICPLVEPPDHQTVQFTHIPTSEYMVSSNESMWSKTPKTRPAKDTFKWRKTPFSSSLRSSRSGLLTSSSSSYSRSLLFIQLYIELRQKWVYYQAPRLQVLTLKTLVWTLELSLCLSMTLPISPQQLSCSYINTREILHEYKLEHGWGSKKRSLEMRGRQCVQLCCVFSLFSPD